MMKEILKQLFSFILPITVLVIVPLSIEKKREVQSGFALVPGIALITLGLIVMGFTISSFIRIGKGTLAPWSPTRKLVIRGLYRYVRNPMILGVLTVLLGEAFCLWSKNILVWAAVFFITNTVYFIVSEEPGLEQRFGDDYREYKRHVSRWLPRITPYSPGEKKI